jgi:tRNA dimethylallyltransferase
MPGSRLQKGVKAGFGYKPETHHTMLSFASSTFSLSPVKSSDLPKIVIICGPTGVGKTSFAIAMARRFGGQIVGADSMQIYRHMTIGTAKPTAEEQADVPHHMVDLIDPAQPFDAASYAEQAYHIIQGMIENGVHAFVVGGTGLYIKALVYGLFHSRTSSAVARRKLRIQMARQGAAAMHTLLAAKDPQAAQRIHPNDAYRILRALEVIETTGRAISAHHQTHSFNEPRFQTLAMGLRLPREQLYTRIDRRVDAMVAAGLLQETRMLLDRGYDPDLKAMQSLGYRHMVDFIRGKSTWEETLRTLKRDHRRYAKRQLTWFNAVEDIHWLSPDQVQEGIDLIERFFSPIV